MKLSELQAAFQAAVIAGDTENAAVLGALLPAKAGGPCGFTIHVNAYRIRLAEFLKEDYPAVKALLGDERFEQLAEDYLAAHPSRAPNARWFSSRLPEFMRESEAWCGYLREISVALFERALTDAFDAADAEPLAIEALAAFDAGDWPRLTFSFHPSLALLVAEDGALDAYTAAVSGEKMRQEVESGAQERIAVWRAGEESVYRRLDEDEYLALAEAAAGRAFGDICQMAAFQQSGDASPERLAQFLISWFADGMVVGAGCGDDSFA